MRARRPQIYKVESWGARTTHGVAGTRHVTIHGYAKENTPGAPYCVVNEYICGRLGQIISLPIPPGAIVEGSGPAMKAWMTLSFSAMPLPPVDPAAVAAAQPTLSAEIVVFDLLIANGDRHRGNLAHFSGSKRVEVYDHSHALLGAQAGVGVVNFRAVVDQFAIDGSRGNRHCLIDALDDADAVAKAVEATRRAVRDVDIRRICAEAGLLDVGIDATEAKEVADLLIERKRKLGDLVVANKAEFKGVPAGSWPVVI